MVVVIELIAFSIEHTMELPAILKPRKAFLILPYDIIAKVYKEVFAGSQIHLDLAKGSS